MPEFSCCAKWIDSKGDFRDKVFQVEADDYEAAFGPAVEKARKVSCYSAKELAVEVDKPGSTTTQRPFWTM